MNIWDKKTHFKMYKSKKGWIIAGVTLFLLVF
ncbi:KxYKxGKxW signal peptide domain-containing protein [Secundilactobacillus malefermentans]